MKQTVPFISNDMRIFLRTTAKAILDSCSVPVGATCGNFTNMLGFRAVTPGGYPSVWVQDFTMNFSSGLISREDGIRHLRLILESQNGGIPKELGNNVIVPPHAIPDHINLNREPVYFPGTYEPSANQDGQWGLRPPTNNHYDVIWLAQMLALSGDAPALLRELVNGKSVYERLKLAFSVPEIDPRTELVHTTPDRRAVGFIFCDSIYMTGDLLMASLLRHRAAEHMAYFAGIMGHDSELAEYNTLALRISQNILPVFCDEGHHGGWLKASTGVSSQPDVWGSIYAVYRGIVKGEDKSRLLQTIVRSLEMEGEIEFQGALRHVPLSFDASEKSAWERTITAKNRYQNGAYWHTPVGCLLAILKDDYPEHARDVREHWLQHLRMEHGRVWECIGWAGKANQNPGFAPSITLPLGVL
ncbi:MAG: hypothetical protein WCP55_23910 [Lentisphaerota bacterium]